MGAMSVTRRPAVAGQFYASDRATLEREVERCYTGPGGPGHQPELAPTALPRPTLLMVPHAGYMYSGPVAAWGYAAAAALGRPEVAILLGPNHRGLTLANTIDIEGAWATPLGTSPVAEGIGRAILAGCPALQVEPSGGRLEHSLEVQLPFLQLLYGLTLPIVPVMVSSRDSATIGAIGEAIARAAPTAALLVASTDMTHFESAETARAADRPALDAVEALDAEALAGAVARGRITMCGWAATAVGITAARALGATRCSVLRYASSGDVTGDRSSVVAYASAISEP
jgi:MEMO1 family protein